MFIDVLDRFGAEDVQLCYQCGDCSTVCPHADEVYSFHGNRCVYCKWGSPGKLKQHLNHGCVITAVNAQPNARGKRIREKQ